MNPSSAFAKIHARRCPNIAAPGDGRTPAWTGPRAKTNFQTRSKGGKLIANGANISGVGVDYYIGGQVADYTIDPIWELSVFLTTTVGDAGAAIGDKLHDKLFGQHSSGSTTPIAVLNNERNTPNQNLANRTVTIAVPKATETPGTKLNGPTGGNGGGGGNPGGGTPSTTSYTVRRGDTLGDIAWRNGTTVAKILALNPSIKDPNKIYGGQNIVLPRR